MTTKKLIIGLSPACAFTRERAAELAPRSNSDCLSCNRSRTMYWHSVLFARNNLARACPRKSSDVPRAKPLPPFRQFPFPIKLSTNYAERAPWHSFLRDAPQVAVASTQLYIRSRAAHHSAIPHCGDNSWQQKSSLSGSPLAHKLQSHTMASHYRSQCNI